MQIEEEALEAFAPPGWQRSALGFGLGLGQQLRSGGFALGPRRRWQTPQTGFPERQGRSWNVLGSLANDHVPLVPMYANLQFFGFSV